MSVYKVSYQYAAPNGASRTGSLILEAESNQAAMSTARESLIGKLKYLKVTNAQPYEPDQSELNLPAGRKK